MNGHAAARAQEDGLSPDREGRGEDLVDARHEPLEVLV